MATLTPEQRQAVEEAGEAPVRIEDPETHTTYVILRADVYDQIKPDHGAASSVPEGIERSQRSFLSALPTLLSNRLGQWACFRGEERVGIAKDKTSLVRECIRRGIDDYYIGMIVPHSIDDEVEEIDDSFVELDS